LPRFVTSDDVKIFYEVFGKGGEPLLFIHPPLMGHVVFKYQRQLETQYQVILMDQRGHGHSTHTPEDYSFARHVEDIRELVDHLNLSKVTLVGYSAAGMLALDFALKYPNRVNHIIMSGGFPMVATWLLRMEFFAGISLMKKKKVTFLSKVLAWSHKVTIADQKELFRIGERANPDVVLELYEDYLAYNCVDDLHKLAHIPTLVVYGSRAYHTNPHAKYFENHLPSVKIAYVDRGSHQLPTKYHEPFNHAIVHFLQEKPAIVK
jgi:pimeloyl-ACP methyl ester carboxylesterase